MRWTRSTAAASLGCDRGHAAARHLRGAFPGVAVTYRVRFPHEALVTYTDGPSYYGAERLLLRQYGVGYLDTAHLNLRRQLSLTAVLHVLSAGNFRPRTMGSLQMSLHGADAEYPSELAVLLAGMYKAGGEDPSWAVLVSPYPALLRWVSPERLATARAVLSPPAAP